MSYSLEMKNMKGGPSTHLSPLVTHGEAAEHPGCHPRLGRHILPAHGLRGGESLVSVALNTVGGLDKYYYQYGSNLKVSLVFLSNDLK